MENASCFLTVPLSACYSEHWFLSVGEIRELTGWLIREGQFSFVFFHLSFSSISSSQFLLVGSVCIIRDQAGPDAAVSSRGCTEQGMWPALSVAPRPIPSQPAARVLRTILPRLFSSYSATGLADYLFLYSVVSRYLKLYGNRSQSWTLCSPSSVLFKQFSCLAFPLLC